MQLDPNSNSLPKRSEIPQIKGTPEGSAWFWGKKDEVSVVPTLKEGGSVLTSGQLGRLNMLTPARTAAAAKLITRGETVNLKYPIHILSSIKSEPNEDKSWRADLPNPPLFGREPFEHRIKSLGPAGNDEIIQMNSQSGSQVIELMHDKVSSHC
jgi:hypothetical protein